MAHQCQRPRPGPGPCPLIRLLMAAILCASAISVRPVGGARAEPVWGSECPRECQCHLTSLGHATMTQWIQSTPNAKSISKKPMKVAMCVLGPDGVLAKISRRIPSDTQVLTMLQTQDCPPEVLMERHVDHLRQLLGLEIRAHVPLSSSSSHLALGSEVLRPLRKLQYLSLNGVDMAALPLGLSKLHGLRYLSLCGNQLDAFPRNELSGLLSLEELTITDNELTEIPPLAFIDLPALRRIRLQRNRIQSLDANSFVNLDDLQLLDMSENNISDISMISFPPLPQLARLHLHDNPIRVVFLNAFHYLNHTRTLTIGQRSQPMHIMKHSFVGLSSVHSLVIPNLDNHMIEKDMFQGLASLRSLTVRGQIKMTGSDAFAGAHDLESLSLSRCRLRSLAADTFRGLHNLRTLDLSHNTIMKLAADLFEPLANLNELQLQDNHLRHLPGAMLAHLRLSLLRLEDNPWHCTCAMAKWNRSPIGRVKTTVQRACATAVPATEATFTDADEGGGLVANTIVPQAAAGDDVTAAAATIRMVGGCRRLRYRYVRDPSLRPLCYNPPEVRGKRVFEAVRKQLHCYD